MRREEGARGERVLADFRREIAANLATLERVQPRHEALGRRLGAAAARPGGAEETAFDAFVTELDSAGLDVKPLPDVAWETAVTTGALRLLDYEQAAVLSETYLIQRGAIMATLDRISDRFMIPDNFDPARRRTMLRTHQMLLVELSGQESYLVEVYRRAQRRLGGR